MVVMKRALSDPSATVRAEAVPLFKLGSIAGRLPLDSGTLREAQRFSAQFFKSQAAIEFSGDDVETFKTPDWAPKTWLPLKEAKALGFAPRAVRTSPVELVATCGVDLHVDNINGLTACLVLHNDALQFKQGRVLHTPEAGDWFIFDDDRAHRVRSAPGEAVFLGLVLPLVKLA